jgi:peptidoglycan/LPS O-acetylase OafA/YrhL
LFASCKYSKADEIEYHSNAAGAGGPPRRIYAQYYSTGHLLPRLAAIQSRQHLLWNFRRRPVLRHFRLYNLSLCRTAERPGLSPLFPVAPVPRTNPAYYAAVLLTIITWIPSLVRHQRPPITAWQVLSWTILLPFPGDPTRALSQSWTLCFEWFFYLLFFLLILTGTQKKAGILCWLLGGLAFFGWLLRNYVAGCVFLEKNGATVFFLRHPLIRLLGDASYSIYLCHFIVLGLLAALYLRVGFFLNPYLAIPIHAAIAVAGSLLFYKWVEQPLLLWLKRYDTPKYSPPRSVKP